MDEGADLEQIRHLEGRKISKKALIKSAFFKKLLVFNSESPARRS